MILKQNKTNWTPQRMEDDQLLKIEKFVKKWANQACILHSLFKLYYWKTNSK